MRCHKLFLRSVLFGLIAGVWGCATTSNRYVPETAEVDPFPRDSAPKELVTNCRSQDLDACGALDDLNAKILELEQLHENQHAELEAILKEISRLLNYKELPPAATVTAKKPVTKGWADPQASYPSKMVVRIEYKRGLERMQAPGDLPKELVSQIKKLSGKSKKFRKAWDKQLQASRVVLPKRLLEKRKMGSITFELSERKPKSIKNLPADLLDKYIRRDRTAWAALASHVVTEPDLRYRSVQDHEVAVHPALTVRRPAKGKGKYVVTESTATRERLKLTSTLKAEHFCETLRAELRFYPSDGAPEMKVVFRPVSKRRSSR